VYSAVQKHIVDGPMPKLTPAFHAHSSRLDTGACHGGPPTISVFDAGTLSGPIDSQVKRSESKTSKRSGALVAADDPAETARDMVEKSLDYGNGDAERGEISAKVRRRLQNA
jgi:hypothetical protein